MTGVAMYYYANFYNSHRTRHELHAFKSIRLAILRAEQDGHSSLTLFQSSTKIRLRKTKFNGWVVLNEEPMNPSEIQRYQEAA